MPSPDGHNEGEEDVTGELTVSLPRGLERAQSRYVTSSENVTVQAWTSRATATTWALCWAS